jgi:hypothetical protein
MSSRDIFPVQALSESSDTPAIKLEGQKVVFDKKVSLLPVDIRKEEPTNNKSGNGRADRNTGA